MVGTGKTSGIRRRTTRWGSLVGAVALAAAAGAAPATAAPAAHRGSGTTTPIKHLVVIYDENVSFDHYFGTYPRAANTDGTRFTAARSTPKADNLLSAGLLKNNPNLYAPQRLSPSQALTCDQNHSYGPEQYAYDGGKADQFVQNTETSKCSGNLYGEPGLSMDYYDGNTVTAMWNYAQHYALNDHSFSSNYGPSTPGALNLVSGDTHGVYSVDPASGTENPRQTATPDPYTVVSPDANGVGTVANDPDPAYDDCADSDHTSTDALAVMKGRNVGDLLNAKGVTWGWFQGGFAPSTAWDGKSADHAACAGDTHTNIGGAASEDYSPHHDPFQYYKSTSNPHHLAPRNTAEIGHNGQANHQYDLSAFDTVVKDGKLPAVSFLKAAEYQDGHAGYSDPTDEQHFVVKEINELQKSRQWQDTAVVIAYDDSDGWYDQVMSPVRNGSKDTTTGSDGKAADSPACQSGPAALGGFDDRCGPGTRQPLLVVSPYSRTDSIDHRPTEQASITKFIEDNWRTGRIGSGSFDQRAGSLDGMFDFRHPNDEQVLLKADGSVASVSRIHQVGDPEAGDRSTGNAPVADGAATEQLAETGTSFPVTAIGTGAVVVVAVGGAIALTTRRRRGNTA
ncbi:phospholipase C [Streptantibioticus silvisoli]|uniref:Alkaline phosphatase family protein n=1 Tax=Streptantibioticus silvisoli TaxID=2705255 RepID=A0ABT6W8Z0_9ACTN|nr:alkaline phosphatase family protein [Streptantibioticus silvisoli]MDI5967230.1 alkaline phosphatase family protein [Streptantibioticus silvisoli]